jgi:hypothetical protein
MSPASLLCLKKIPGYFLLDAFICSISSFSKAFFLEVACLDFDAFALKRAIKSNNSAFLVSFFLFLSARCFNNN